MIRFILTIGIFTEILWADGAVFTTTKYPLETSIQSQQVFINYIDSTEVLVLQADFVGKGDKFLWMVPVPNLPQIDTISPSIFNFLEIITPPSVTTSTFLIVPGFLILTLLFSFPVLLRRNIKAWLITSLGIMFGVLIIIIIAIVIGINFLPLSRESTREIMPISISGVKMHETKRVGIYDINILSITSPGTLKNWVDTNGYYLPEKASLVIEEYIMRHWFFIAVKISSDIFKENQIKKIPPLKITFTTLEPVYPLKITSLSKTKTNIIMYIIGKQPFYAKGFKIEEIRQVDSLYISTLIERYRLDLVYNKEPYFLIKLYNSISPTNMNKDITFIHKKLKQSTVNVYTDEAKKYIVLILSICFLFIYIGILMPMELRKKFFFLSNVVLILLFSRFWILFEPSRYFYRETARWESTRPSEAKIKFNMIKLQQSLVEFANITGGYYPANLHVSVADISNQLSLGLNKDISITGAEGYKNVFPGEIGSYGEAILRNDIINPIFSEYLPAPIITTSPEDPPTEIIPGIIIYVPLEIKGNIAEGYKIYGAGTNGLLSLVLSSEDKKMK